MAQVFETIGAVTSTSRGTVVTSGADGAWGTSYTELSSSTSVAWDGFFLDVGNISTSSQMLVNVASGAVSSEVSIVTAFLVGGSNSNSGKELLYFPLPVDSGTRISVRTNANFPSINSEISIIGVGTTQTKFFKEAGGEETLGFDDTSTSIKGTSIDPGTSANTKGVWVELDASAADDVDYISIDFVNTDTTISGNHDWLFDIGTGAADSETVIIDNIPGHSSGGNDEYTPGTAGPFLVSVSSGTRIAVRCQSSTTTTGDREIFVVLHSMKLADAGAATLSALSGSFALTGQTADTLVGHQLDALSGSFTLTGQDASTLVGFLLSALSGSFVLTGQDATTSRTHILSADSGSFTLTGQDATTSKGGDATLIASSGSFSMTGQAAETLVGHLIDAASGSFVLTGQNAETLVGHLVSAESGSFTLTGQAADTLVGHLVSALSGSFTFTGQDATLTAADLNTLIAETGLFALTGQVANFSQGVTPEVPNFPRTGITGSDVKRKITGSSVKSLSGSS